jgi:hypothetical protein
MSRVVRSRNISITTAVKVKTMDLDFGRRILYLLTIFLLAAAFFSMIAFLPNTAHAAKEVTVVAKEVKGPVTLIMADGKKRPLKDGDKVGSNDVIESGPGGMAVLNLSDGSKVEVFEATRLEVNEILPEEESRFSISLFFGRVVAKLKRLRGDDVVITPTMVAGVRGTDFAVSVAEDGTSVVSVDKGVVKCSSDKAWDKTSGVDVEAGMEVLADKSGVVLTPRPMEIKTLEDWTEFRQARLEAMQADLPSIIARMEKGVDPSLAILDKITAMPQDRAELLKKTGRKAQDARPGRCG